MSFVLDPHTPWELTRRLPAGRSIGLSPPRLLYGRAANYGSIINLRACHGLPPVAIRLSLHRFDRSPFGSWRTCRSGSGFPLSSENVSGGCVFSFQRSWVFRAPLSPWELFWQITTLQTKKILQTLSSSLKTKIAPTAIARTAIGAKKGASDNTLTPS